MRVAPSLSGKTQIQYIDLRVFAHATEDLEKVLSAARNILPVEAADSVVFKKTSLTGHHGNPIVLVETRIKDAKIVQAAFQRLGAGLSLLDKESLNDEIMQHVENGNLYLRLDKQSAFLNQLKLSTSDPIHLKIHFKKHGAQEILDICRKSGLLP